MSSGSSLAESRYLEHSWSPGRRMRQQGKHTQDLKASVQSCSLSADIDQSHMASPVLNRAEKYDPLEVSGTDYL